MKKLLFFVLIFIGLHSRAQDTLQIMQYNLLNFGVTTDYCTVSNNNPESKTAWLKTIIDYYLPDIFAVNEISSNPIYHNKILNEVMNTSGRTWYQKAAATNYANSEIVNMLYFDSRKVGLRSQYVITTAVRDINVYKLFAKFDGIVPTGDTAFFYCMVAHLKAGTTAGDATTRGQMASAVMQYLQNHQITQPCLIMGDFNLQNSSETAWNYLTDFSAPAYNFSDPVDMEGFWHANAGFALYHTQSTHKTSNGCAAAGGFDDRFDFILINNSLQSEESAVKYIDGSYRTIGQDGLRFNSSLTDPPNSTAPSAIINALYNMSDHLPLTVELQVSTPQTHLCEELFFSEYIEGTGNNKALEIFNPTGTEVSLAGYRLARYANGGTLPDVINLGGKIGPQSTYVVVLDKRNPNGTGTEVPVDPALQALADTFLCPDYNVNMTMYFNGDDAMALQKTDGQLVDLIGKIGQDPGLGWTDDSLCGAGAFTTNCGALAWTTNHTLVRKRNVQQGLVANPAAFDVTAFWDTLPVNSFDSLRFHRSLCGAELPANWVFTETMISHIFILPGTVVPLLNENYLSPGDYLGVFFLNGNTEICGGYSKYTGNGSLSVVAFGDDETTAGKDGFAEDENIIWKVFSFTENTGFYAEATYNPVQNPSDGKFQSFGISLLSTLKAYDLEELTVNLPTGWSGISVPVNPRWKLLENFFGDATEKVIYLSDGVNIYYPAGNQFGITEISGAKSYFVKNSQGYDLEITGLPLWGKTIQLATGWNFFPVLSLCEVETSLIQSALGAKLEMIKDVAGLKVFWPSKGINTLNLLVPGKGYYLKVNQNCSFIFPDCE